jgi:hypothetical protein
MNHQRTVSQWLDELGMDVAQLVASSGIDRKVVEAIVADRYTTSPAQRERIAAAMGVSAQQIRWGNAIEVDHLYGHGPQFGRSP